MKKILSILACFVMILVGGVALAACGNKDEFANAEKVTAEEVSTYINSEDVENENFTKAFKMSMNVSAEGMKMIADISVQYDSETNVLTGASMVMKTTYAKQTKK